MGYSGPQACKITGVTYRQLDYWAREHIIEPSIVGASGSGSQRRYSYRDLLVLRLIKKLLDHGLAMPAVRKVLDTASHLLGDAPSSLDYLLIDRDAVLVRDGEDVVNLLRRGQLHFGFFVSLAELDSDVQASVSALFPGLDGSQPSLFDEVPVAS
jgi:DNA-binding transcriptional MerR regulator